MPRPAGERPTARPDERPLRPAFPPVTPSSVSPGRATSPADDAEDGTAIRPRWQAVSSAESPTAESPERPVSPWRAAPAPRPAERARWEEPEEVEDYDDEDDDDEPRNPVVTFVKYLLLVVAGVVIGILVAILVVTVSSGAEVTALGSPYDLTQPTTGP